MSSLPSGTVTFLFTDIEGSTRLAQQYPDAMPALLARQHEVLRTSIQAQGGYIFQVVGDSFSAAFHSAIEALHAALNAQIHLHQADWTSVPFKVRMGIHTGTATLADDPNIEGPYTRYSTLALTQRIMSAAHGGQILLSQSTYELTRDATTAEAVIDEGKHVAQVIHHKFSQGLMFMVRANQAASLQHDLTAARAYSEEGLRLIRDVGNPFFTAITIMGLGSVALAEGNYAEARVLLEESERLFYELGNRPMALGVQSERAHIERQLGNYVQAVELYHQSIRAWQELGHRVSLAHEFECLAFIACSQSRLQRAARLLGAAESIRQTLNSPMTATERIEYDQNISVLRTRMEQSDLATAWAQGRMMTLEQAVEFALKNT